MSTTPMDADTLFSRFQVEMDSLEKFKGDFKDTTEYMKKVTADANSHMAEDTKKMVQSHGENFKNLEKTAIESAGKIKSSVGEIASALGLGNLAGIMTGAGLALSAVAFLDEVRKIAYSQMQASSMLTGAGGGVATLATANQFGQFQEHMRNYYRQFVGLGSPEEVAKVSGMLMTTRNISGADLFGKGGKGGKGATVEQAMLMGRSTGFGSEKVAQMFSTMVEHLGVDARNVGEAFTTLYEKSKKAGDVNAEYIQTILNITSTLRSYGANLDTVSDTMFKFQRDLDKGVVSVEDLTKAFTTARSTTEGQRAFLGMQVFANDPALAGLFKGVDPITAMGRAQELMEKGTILGHQVSSHQYGAAMHDLFTNADTMALSALRNSGAPETDENRRYFQQKMLTATTGVNWQNLRADEQDKLLHAFETKNWSKETTGLLSKGRENEMQELMKIGDTLGKIEEDPLKRILELMERLVQFVGGMLLSPIFGAAPKNVRDLAMSALSGGEINNTDDVNDWFNGTDHLMSIINLNKFATKAVMSGHAYQALEGAQKQRDTELIKRIKWEMKKHPEVKQEPVHVTVTAGFDNSGKAIIKHVRKEMGRNNRATGNSNLPMTPEPTAQELFQP